MTSRRLNLLLALPAAFALVACTSSTSGDGKTTTPASPGISQRVPSGGTPADAAGLGALLLSGIKSIQTAHIRLDISLTGQSITGEGDEELAGGKLVAFQVSESVPGVGQIQLVIADGKTYAKLPSSLNKSGKPWVLVSANSSDPVIQQLASTVESAQSSASLGSVTAFVGAADAVKLAGHQSIGGLPTTHYSVVVNTDKLPPEFPGKDALTAGGLKTIPVELYVDGQGRPVQVTEHLTVSGQSVSTTIVVSRYNQPVTISAPPADQVSSD